MIRSSNTDIELFISVYGISRHDPLSSGTLSSVKSHRSFVKNQRKKGTVLRVELSVGGMM